MWAGMEYTASVGGGAFKEVHCAECGREFFYALQREAKGKGSSLYFLDNKGARERADEAARRRLAKELESAIDPVPCPGCGHVQADMVRAARKTRLRWLAKLGWLLVIAVATVGGMNFLTTGLDLDEPPGLFPWAPFLMVAWVGPAVLLLRFALNAAWDLNNIPLPDRLAAGKELAMERAEVERILAEFDAAAAEDREKEELREQRRAQGQARRGRRRR